MHPILKVAFRHLIQVRFTRDLNIVAALCDVHAVEQRDESQMFHGDCKLIVNHVEEMMCRLLFVSGDSKVVDLAFEYTLLTPYVSQVQALRLA